MRGRGREKERKGKRGRGKEKERERGRRGGVGRCGDRRCRVVEARQMGCDWCNRLTHCLSGPIMQPRRTGVGGTVREVSKPTHTHTYTHRCTLLPTRKRGLEVLSRKWRWEMDRCL